MNKLTREEAKEIITIWTDEFRANTHKFLVMYMDTSREDSIELVTDKFMEIQEYCYEKNN